MIFPVVIPVMAAGCLSFVITAAPLPVTVQVEALGRWFPYSRGKRNCFSALAKWLDAIHMSLSAAPAEIISAPSDNASPNVEHAPYIPKCGISYLLIPKDVAISCPNKSPDNIYLICSFLYDVFIRSLSTTASCKALSACSQLSFPDIGSFITTSNFLPSGPSLSFSPTTDAVCSMYTGISNLKL